MPSGTYSVYEAGANGTKYYSNPNASSIVFTNAAPFVITPGAALTPPATVRQNGLGGTWVGSMESEPVCVEQPCISFNVTLADLRTFTTARNTYIPAEHDLGTCTRSDMFDQDTCTVQCVPGYAVANSTFLCDSTRQVAMVDRLYAELDQQLSDGAPPEYARWVGSTKVQQYSLQLTFPACEPLVCTFGGWTGGFDEGMLSATVSTVDPFRRVMSDTAQFGGHPLYAATANPYPAIYDFDNRNKSCAGHELVFMDDCIAFCNPFGYE